MLVSALDGPGITIQVPKGALLLGPPGCGKTLLAKAIATEANVPFLSMNGSEFIEMIGGLGAARVRDLFKEAVSRAPCIIYIDEIDAIGRARSSEGSSFGPGGGEGEQTLNQLLVEMDGMKSREGVLVLGSTNRGEVLDKALLRPGRFDRLILIDLPTVLEREEIFKSYLDNLVMEKMPPYYLQRLAFLTPGFSGADIANVCNEAALHAATHSQVTVRMTDLDYAVERVIGGPKKRSFAMSLLEREMVAYHEAGHALVGWLLEHTEALLKISIVPRVNRYQGFTQYVSGENRLLSQIEQNHRMCMALGGRAAESIVFNKVTNGAQSDLAKVTNTAYLQVRVYGMVPSVGLMSFPDVKAHQKHPYSNALKKQIDFEARRIIATLYYQTETLLRENLPKLALLAQELLKRETLNYDDVEALIGPPTYPKKRFVDPIEFENSITNMGNAATGDNAGPSGAGASAPPQEHLN